MCGKGSSSGFGGLAPMQSSVTQASPQAIGAYTQALGLAQNAVNQPFQKYSTDPNAFVAPLTGTQQQAIGGIQGAQGAYQPYYQAAGALTGAAGTTTTPQVVGQYMNPFMQQVVNPVQQALQQQQGQQLAQQQAEAIRSGAFGGSRADVARQTLRGQQQLGMGQALSPLYQQGYGQALQAAQGDLARQLQAGQALGTLGTGAQTAALQAPQALLGAGTLEQQTQQAGLSALYNQFLQERAYPYQQAQFFANVAGGLGPLLGQGTYQSQAQNPFGMFLSEPDAKMGVDGRAKAAMGGEQERTQPDVVGKTFDDQNIYAYRYKDGSPAQLGLMADEVQRQHPDAVAYGPDGLRRVDYAAATDMASRLGGAVKETGGDYAQGGYAIGGHLAYVDPSDPGASERRRMDALLASHKGGLSGASSEYGPTGQSYVTQKTYVPAGTVRAGQQLEHARFSPVQQQGGLLSSGERIADLLSKGSTAYSMYKNRNAPTAERVASEYRSQVAASPSELKPLANGSFMAAGGIVPTTYLPEEVTGEVKTSGGLRPAEISRRDQEESGLGKLMSVGEKALDIGIKYGPMIKTGLTALASMSEPGMKTGVRPAARDGMGVRPANEDDIFERGIIGAESRGRQFDEQGRPLTSPAGAIGIAQVMPGTAPEAAKLAGLEYDPVRYRTDPEYNKALGRAYFNKQLETFGSEDKAAAAYNAGPGALQKALARAEREGGDYLSYLPAETRAYVPKVLGLAGARGEGEGTSRLTPESVSRAREGLRLDRMSGNFTPEQRRMMALDESSRKEGVGAAKEGGLGDYLTSEEFLIPALTGLGTALTSTMQAPTTSLGAALAGGLGAGTVAGAKSVLDTKAKQAEIEKAKQEAGFFGRQADVEAVEASKRIGETAKNAILTDNQGNPNGLVAMDPKTGKMRFFDWGEAYNRREELNLVPELRQEVEKAQAAKERGIPYREPPGGVPTVEPKADEKLKEEPGKKSLMEKIKEKEAKEKGQPAALTPLPSLFSLKSEDQKVINEQVKALTPTTAARDTKNYFEEQNQKTQLSNDQKPYVMEFAEAFSRLPEKGPLAPGAFNPFSVDIFGKINSLMTSLGRDPLVSKEDLATAEEIRKIGSRMQGKIAESGGQKSYAAFNDLAVGVPSGATTREGIAKNMSSIIVNNQKEIDKQGYFNSWFKSAEKVNPTLATRSGGLADTQFGISYNKQYEKDRKAIERMFLEPVMRSKNQPIIDDRTGRPMNWISYITRYGSQVPPEVLAEIERKWGDGILRYFPSVERR